MAECAVGLLNVSLGGSPIESWMDADALRAFPEALADLEPYLGDGVASKKSAIPLPNGTGGTKRLDTRLWPMPTMNGCH